MSGIKATNLTPEQTINPYKILSVEEYYIINRIGLKGSEMDNTDNNNLTTNALAEVFEGAGTMFKQINYINKLKLKRKKEQATPSLIEYIGTSKIAVFSLFVMAAVFSDSNVLYNQLAQMNKKTGIDKPIAKSIGDSLYVWAVQITALPVKAVFSVGMFIDSLMVLALISVPVTIQALRDKFNNKDSPELSELFHLATGFIIKPFTYDILNPYILFKDYVPVVSWVLGARKLFSGYTQINTKLEKESTTVSSTASTATATNTTEKSHSIKPIPSIAKRLKSFIQAIPSNFTVPSRKTTQSSIETEVTINNNEADPFKEHLKLVGKTSSDIALNAAINSYINDEPNSSRELKREIAIRYLEPKISHTNDIKLLNSIAIASNEPLLEILADCSRSKILMEIFQERELKNTIIDYLSSPTVSTLSELQKAINQSYQKNMLSINTHYLPAHKNEFQKIYEQLAQATGIDLLHDKHGLLSRTIDIKFSHVSHASIYPYASKPPVNFDSKLIQAMKEKHAKNPELTKFAAGEEFKHKTGEGFALPKDVYIVNINGTQVFIEKTEKKLGEGTSGIVYKGVDLASGQKYALKILSVNEDIADLEREVRTFNLYYDDQPDKKAYLVTNQDSNVIIMPLLEGKRAVIYPDKQDKKLETQKKASNLEQHPAKIFIPEDDDSEDDGTFKKVRKESDPEEEKRMAELLDKGEPVYECSHANRITVAEQKAIYEKKYVHLSQNEKEKCFLQDLKNATIFYKGGKDEAKVTTQATPKQSKTLENNFDTMLLTNIIEDFKAICRAVSDGHKKGIIFRDLKPDNFNISTAPNTGETIANLFDFGTCQVLNNGESIIVDSGTLVYGSEYYLTPENININYDIKNNLRSYEATTKVQALRDILDNSNHDFKNTIEKELNDITKQKIDFILKNPTLLDKFVYSEKTDTYALGCTLEEMIVSRLKVASVETDLPDRYVCSADDKLQINSNDLDRLNDLLKIATDLKDKSLQRMLPAQAIEELDKLNLNQRKLQI